MIKHVLLGFILFSLPLTAYGQKNYFKKSWLTPFKHAKKT